MLFKLFNSISIGQKLVRHIHIANTVYFKAPITMATNAGMDLVKIVEALESFAPKQLAESWDNTGLLIEPFTPRLINKILLTIDLTYDVALEARDKEYGLVICYHPPIFAPLKSVTQKSWKEQIVTMLLERGIALYSPHTCWDSVDGGVNDWLASAFPGSSSRPIVPGPTPDVGSGRILVLKNPVSLTEAVESVKCLTGLGDVRVAVGRKHSGVAAAIGTVALCAGSGGSVLKGVEADLYITGEMQHHDLLDATQRHVSVILTNHSNSERGFLSLFAPRLASLLGGTVQVSVSSVDCDPLRTY